MTALVLLLTGERRAAKFALAIALGAATVAIPLAVIGQVRYSACRDDVYGNLRKYGVGTGAGRAFTADYEGPFLVDCERVRRSPWETYN